MTVTMPTMEELMVMGTAIISRCLRMVAGSSGRSSASWGSWLRVIKKFISI